MNTQIRTGSCALCLLILTFSGYSQSGLSVISGTSLSVLPGTIFSTDSLVLVPSAKFTINGANGETRTPGIIHPLTKSYISRVFHFAATLTAYNGEVIIYYQDAELKGIPEAKLTLNVHNGSNWTTYTSNITRDGTQNFVSTSGLNNISLNELTLADGSSGNALITSSTDIDTDVRDGRRNFDLIANDANSGSGNTHLVTVSPNPASNIVNVQLTGFTGKVILQLMNLQGRSLKAVSLQADNVKSMQQQFNVADVASGTYFIVAVDEKGNKETKKVVVTH